jgi:hypothetical protein
VSVEALAACLHHSRSKGTAKVVLLGIANHDGDGGAWPSIATLAKYANVAPRNVQMALRSLEGLGEIRVHLQAGGTGAMPDHTRPNQYTILVRCPDACDRSTAHRVKPGHRGGDASITRGGDEIVTGGVTPASPKPSCEPPDEPSEDVQSSRHAAACRTKPKRGKDDQKRKDDLALLRDIIGADVVIQNGTRYTVKAVYDAMFKHTKAEWPGAWAQGIDEADYASHDSFLDWLEDRWNITPEENAS